MTNLTDNDAEAKRRRKFIALSLIVLALILFVITLVYWLQAPDDDPGPMAEDVVEDVSRADN